MVCLAGDQSALIQLSRLNLYIRNNIIMLY